MPDFYGFCVALLAAVGLICLVWMLAGFILRPKEETCVTAVIRARTAEELTRAAQDCGWLRGWGGGDFSLLIISDDLEPEAERLARLYAEGGARVCRMDELEKLIF